jgi:small conductance mechanosensitive channel
MDGIVEETISVATRIAIAVVVMATGLIVAVIARRFVRRFLGRPEVTRVIGRSLARLVASVVFYLILIVAAAVSLIALGVPATVVSTAAIVVIALIGIALQQSVANFAATVIFLMFQPFRRGDVVRTMGHIGVVQEILPFNTVLLLPDERLVSLPNSKVQESGIVNYSQMGRVRATFTLTVAYGADLDRVRRVIADVACDDPRILHDPPIDVFVDELDEIGIRLLISPAVLPNNYLSVRSDLRERIAARFGEEGIHFAVPRHHVRLDTGRVPAGEHQA